MLEICRLFKKLLSKSPIPDLYRLDNEKNIAIYCNFLYLICTMKRCSFIEIMLHQYTPVVCVIL